MSRGITEVMRKPIFLKIVSGLSYISVFQNLMFLVIYRPKNQKSSRNIRKTECPCRNNKKDKKKISLKLKNPFLASTQLRIMISKSNHQISLIRSTRSTSLQSFIKIEAMDQELSRHKKTDVTIYR